MRLRWEFYRQHFAANCEQRHKSDFHRLVFFFSGPTVYVRSMFESHNQCWISMNPIGVTISSHLNPLSRHMQRLKINPKNKTTESLTFPISSFAVVRKSENIKREKKSKWVFIFNLFLNPKIKISVLAVAVLGMESIIQFLLSIQANDIYFPIRFGHWLLLVCAHTRMWEKKIQFATFMNRVSMMALHCWWAIGFASIYGDMRKACQGILTSHVLVRVLNDNFMSQHEHRRLSLKRR